MDIVNWGIIGSGAVCEVKSGPAFNKIEHSNLVAVMRRTKDKVEDFAHRHQVPHAYTDAEALINNPDINAIYIATPPNMHLPYAIEVAKAGKAIYVEKPMARTYGECKNMIAISQKYNVPLFVAYYRRALPYFLKVKELLNSKAVGRPTSVLIELYAPPKPDDFKTTHDNWRVKPEISGGGYFHDLASHQLDIVSFLLGEITYAIGHSTNSVAEYDAPDIVSASIGFPKGIIGSGLWNFVSTGNHRKDLITIQGTEGSVEFSCFDGNAPIILENGEGRCEFSKPYPAHVQQPLIQTMVDELRGVGKCASTGTTGAQTNWVIDQILKA